MSDKIKQSLIGGIVGTVAMTIIIWMAPLMGFPKISPPDMLAGMLGLPVFVGWVMHFMIGIIFAMAYAFFFIKVVKKVNNNILKGAIFGFVAFIIAQITLAIMGAAFPMPQMEGSMILNLTGSLMGHVVFGITLALVVKFPLIEKH